jgi:N-hydroxyarylamine O-acetyltransferase
LAARGGVVATNSFDFAAYLRRIGYSASPSRDLQTLFALHRAHVYAIPFENLEIQLGGAVRLDPDALQAKLVHRRRGGYCFEHNALFALALRSVGFEIETCEARVRLNASGTIRPRTHMVLTVRCEGRHWLADVGFGGDGLVQPIALDGTSVEQAGFVYRVVPERSLRVLQRQIHDGWEDVYAVLPDSVFAIDFECGNWYTSTHPSSPFVQTLTAQRIVGDSRHVLRNLTYSVRRGGAVITRQITRSELVPLLRDTFDLDVPDDAKFHALDAQ